MAGRIKAGEGTLIGNAGEHYVIAELLKRGVAAAPTPRNTPGIDILAAFNTKTVRIRVKTKSGQYTDWQWVAKEDDSIFRNLSPTGDFIVLVNMTDNIQNMEFFILPTSRVNDWLQDGFKKWVSTPGKNGRPHNPSNRKRHLNYPEFKNHLERFRDWSILWK